MKQSTKNLIYRIFLICHFIIGMMSVIIGKVDINKCDHSNPSWFNVNNLLKVTGLFSMFFSGYYLAISVRSLNGEQMGRSSQICLRIIIVLNVIFFYAWFACGIIILLGNSNHVCLQGGSFNIIYGLVIWSVLTALMIGIQIEVYVMVLFGCRNGYQQV